MKKTFTFLFLLAAICVAWSQSITKSADGENTILAKGSTIGLDIGKTQINLGVNNLQRVIGEPAAFIFGGQVAGENKEGVADLFSKGDFVPASKLEVFAGLYLGTDKKDFNSQMAKSAEVFQKFEEILFSDYRKEIDSIIKTNPAYVDNENPKYLKEILDTINNAGTFKAHSDVVKKYISKDLNLEKVSTVIEKTERAWESARKVFQDLTDVHKANFMPAMPWEAMVFAYGGLSGSEFKRFTSLDTVDLGKSFTDEKFRGNRVGLGANFSIKQWRIGATYGYIKTSNFDLLSKKEYKISSQSTVGNTTLTEEKKVTAYTGTYGEVEFNEFNIDVIYALKLDPSAQRHMLINPYLKAMMMSRNSNFLPNHTDIGCGFYIFKNSGAFIGGLYFELPDVNNNLEKAKPLADQNLRAPLERMSIGIVGKIGINALLK